MLREDGNGGIVCCYFAEHAWADFEKRYHINVKEGLAGYAALVTFYLNAPHRHALAHGNNTTETTTSATKSRAVCCRRSCYSAGQSLSSKRAS